MPLSPLRFLGRISVRCRPAINSVQLQPRLSSFRGSAFSTATPRTMAQEYKLKGVTSLDLKDGQMKDAEVEGIDGASVLLVKSQGKVHATSTKCTHFGAPLKNGVLSSDGRLTCPWHGACFNVATGDVEDAPALDSIAKYELVEKDGAVYVKGEESTFKANRQTMNISCSAQGSDKVVVLGGGAGTIGTIEQLRKSGYKGAITVISSEELPIDRTKLSKALLADLSKAVWRSADFYKSASIDIVNDEATSVDFGAKSVSTKSGKSYPYTKLVLATGGAPRSLPLKGLKENELKNVFLLRTLKHTSAIVEALGGDDAPKKQIVVIGSSFIGMEVGNCLAGKGHKIDIVGMETEPCELVFGAKLGAVFRKLLEKNGVKFHMSAQVSHAEPSTGDAGAVGSVHLKDGTRLPADIVIEGVGVAPATKFLNDSPGAPSLNKDGSVTVDANFCVAGVNDVYAIGDIATYPYKGANVRIEHWNVAQNAGRQVARHIAGKPVKVFTPVFWSALGMQLRYCGNTAASSGYDDVIVQGSTEVGQDKQPSFAAYYVKGDEVVAVATMGKDPVMVQSAELMRRGWMLSRKEIESGGDVMQKSL